MWWPGEFGSQYQPDSHGSRANWPRWKGLRHILAPAEGADNLPDGQHNRRHQFHRGGSTAIPAIGERQQADPSVHQLSWRRCDSGARHLRYDAVRQATDSDLVCGSGLFHGIPPARGRCSRNAILSAQRPDHDTPALWWRSSTLNPRLIVVIQ